MRTIQIGEKQIGLKATPLALVYYKQAFKSDLVSDLLKMDGIEKDHSKMDGVLFLQMAWAMAKACEGVGKKFPDLATWVAELDELDLEELTACVMEEAQKGFFRGRSRTKPKR
jgi:hypothetical protein